MVPETEIRNRVALAIRTGQILHVPYEAVQIASLYNADANAIALELTEAGLRAGINMELGKPSEARPA
ncbi:hypothetical protein SAMN05216548_102385 [Faunimonas pinastri]|uniref:Uncharacterized protein n=2 Tax=Faunimonas pinastri TaxID=1855383 RepID=A0A1H9D8K6_9HYPH|nr:hypothetical protein SAMN05216548_102385 [Faunimonas pinastri]